MADPMAQRAQTLGLNMSLPPTLLPGSPLVVLLGWVGCQDRFLAKYSDMLAGMGYASVRGICPTSAIFWPTASRRRHWATELLTFLQDLNQGASPSRPLVFYAFSNGGAFVVEQIDALLQASAGQEAGQFAQLAPVGCLFDSAPAYMHPTAGAQALATGNHTALQPLLKLLFYLTVAVMLVIEPFRPRNFWRAMTALTLPGPTLYLYSTDDPLCCASKLDGLVAARRVAGRDVRAVCWAESAHVGHLRRHEEAYQAAVRRFLASLTT